MHWSWTAWVVTVAAVALSGAVAAIEGNFQRGARLDMGFVDHGGMWGDLVLLSAANALVIPHVAAAASLLPRSAASAAPGTFAHILCFVAGFALSVLAHRRWYRGERGGRPWREHMWPTRPHGTWVRDLSAAGWLHLLYMSGQLAIVLAYAITPMPAPAVWAVSGLLSVHVPLGLLQPARAVTGRWNAGASRPMLAGVLLAIWFVAAIKLLMP